MALHWFVRRHKHFIQKRAKSSNSAKPKEGTLFHNRYWHSETFCDVIKYCEYWQQNYGTSLSLENGLKNTQDYCVCSNNTQKPSWHAYEQRFPTAFNPERLILHRWFRLCLREILCLIVCGHFMINLHLSTCSHESCNGEVTHFLSIYDQTKYPILFPHTFVSDVTSFNARKYWNLHQDINLTVCWSSELIWFFVATNHQR